MEDIQQTNSKDDDDDRKPNAIDDSPDNLPSHPGGETKRHKVKPALKKPHNHSANNNSNIDGDESNKKKKHLTLKFDEAVIEEHDLLRGTRMKIEEPNTPYHTYDSGAESDDSRRPKSPANQKQTLSWDALQSRLDTVAAVRDAYPSSPSTCADAEADLSDVEEEKKKEMRKLYFKEHRKRHYNEMEAVRKFRQEHPEGLEVAEEIDDGTNDDGSTGDDADVEE